MPPLKCLVSSGRNGPTLNASRNIVGQEVSAGETAPLLTTQRPQTWPGLVTNQTGLQTHQTVPMQRPAFCPSINGASTAAQVQNYQLTPKKTGYTNPYRDLSDQSPDVAGLLRKHRTTSPDGQSRRGIRQTVSSLKASILCLVVSIRLPRYSPLTFRFPLNSFSAVNMPVIACLAS